MEKTAGRSLVDLSQSPRPGRVTPNRVSSTFIYHTHRPCELATIKISLCDRTLWHCAYRPSTCAAKVTRAFEALDKSKDTVESMTVTVGISERYCHGPRISGNGKAHSMTQRQDIQKHRRDILRAGAKSFLLFFVGSRFNKGSTIKL